MPVHEEILRVKEQKPNIGQQEEAVLVREDLRVGARRAIGNVIVAETPDEKGEVEDVSWDEDHPDAHVRVGCVVAPRETHHDRQAGEDLPLRHRVEDKAVAKTTIRESESHLTHDL